jgi:hypothetical protein
MSIQAVLFDFDGTLADTLPLSFRAFQAVFQQYDHREVTREYFTQTNEPERITYIAWTGSQRIGLIQVNYVNEDTVFIHNFCILPACQGKGYGGKVLRQTNTQRDSDSNKKGISLTLTLIKKELYMPVTESIPWIFALLVLLCGVWIVLISWKNGISPMPTSKAVRAAVAGEVNRIPGYANILEAGSGWGTLGLEVIRRCPGKRLTGVENSSIPLWFSQLSAVLYSRLSPAEGERSVLRNKIHFMRGDIYRSSYSDADIVLCYLFPGAMERLAPKFRQELPSGAAVISVCFALPDKQPVRIITCTDRLRTKVYVYHF